MTHIEKDFDFSHLTAAERIMLAQELWDSVHEEVEAAPLTAAQRDELDRRLDELESGKTVGIRWDAVRDTLRPKR
jgi:putative addiction module component (TIGR02574 family)